MAALRCIIEELLNRGYEGGYWDYKSDYPNTAEEKLHDIICMANNLENRDAYLIYGVNNDGSICGIEKTQKTRYTSADIIKFLRSKPFAGGYIPQVEVHTFKMEEHEIDVLVILKGVHTPYYLQEEFGKTNKISNLLAGCKSYPKCFLHKYSVCSIFAVLSLGVFMSAVRV